MREIGEFKKGRQWNRQRKQTEKQTEKQTLGAMIYKKIAQLSALLCNDDQNSAFATSNNHKTSTQADGFLGVASIHRTPSLLSLRHYLRRQMAQTHEKGSIYSFVKYPNLS